MADTAATVIYSLLQNSDQPLQCSLVQSKNYLLSQRFDAQNLRTASFCVETVAGAAAAFVTTLPLDVLCVSEFRRLKNPKLQNDQRKNKSFIIIDSNVIGVKLIN